MKCEHWDLLSIICFDLFMFAVDCVLSRTVSHFFYLWYQTSTEEFWKYVSSCGDHLVQELAHSKRGDDHKIKSSWNSIINELTLFRYLLPIVLSPPLPFHSVPDCLLCQHGLYPLPPPPVSSPLAFRDGAPPVHTIMVDAAENSDLWAVPSLELRTGKNMVFCASPTDTNSVFQD